MHAQRFTYNRGQKMLPSKQRNVNGMSKCYKQQAGAHAHTPHRAVEAAYCCDELLDKRADTKVHTDIKEEQSPPCCPACSMHGMAGSCATYVHVSSTPCSSSEPVRAHIMYSRALASANTCALPHQPACTHASRAAVLAVQQKSWGPHHVPTARILAQHCMYVSCCWAA